MSKIYICDRCGTRVPEAGRFEVIIGRKDGQNEYENAAPKDWQEKDLCKGCVDYLIQHIYLMSDLVQGASAKTLKCMADRESADEPQENKKPYSKPVAKVGPVKKTGGVKRSYVRSDDHAEIERLYLEEGLDMETVSDQLLIGMVPLSRYIDGSGLGRKKYEKKDGRKAETEPTCPMDKPEPGSQEG